MIFMNLKEIFVMMLVMFSDALNVNLTYRPSPALENSPVILTCSYTGLKADEGLSRTSWSVMYPNELVETAGRIILPACSPLGYIDPSLYSYSCANGYFNWTIRDISRINDKELWNCIIVTTLQSQQASKTLSVQVPITSVSMTEPTVSTVTMDTGAAETFKCRTSGGLPQATIKWFKVTGGMCSQSGTAITSSVSSPTVSDVDGLKQVESTLTFIATGTDNGLRICCTASNVAGEHRVSWTKLLDVRYAPSHPPVIKGYDNGSTYSMMENSTENLTCSSTGGNPLATLTWNCFNNQMSDPTVLGSTVKRVVHWTARRNENARCTCTASHLTKPNQPQSAFVNVNVLYPPSIPLFRVTGADVGSSVRILTNSTQTVECTSFGNPFPATSDFTWRKGTTEMSTHSVLNWQGGVKVGDEGSYTCTVETIMTPSDPNKDAKIVTISSTVEITVLYPPNLPTLLLGSSSGPEIDRPLTLVVQRPFTLACNASSKPPANFTWTGGVDDVQGQLLQDMITAKVSTMRMCTARSILNPTIGAARTMSSSATVTININYSPDNIIIRHESVSGTVIQSEFRVIEGNAIKLYCSVQSQPASSFKWFGAGMHSLGSILVYNNTLQSQTGVLACLAENNMTHGNQAVKGSGSQTISLNVLYPPKLRTLHGINAVEGSTLLIQCQYTAGNPIATKLTITRTADGTSWSGDHSIQSIRRADAGLYRCKVENSMDPTGADIRTGRDTADFEIIVWYNTSITRFEVSGNPNQTIVTINESDRFVLVCEVLSNPNSTIRLTQNHMATTLVERENVLEVQYVIHNAVCSDAAVYTCSGFNNYTDLERLPLKELQLFVRCSPRPSHTHDHKRNFTESLNGDVTFPFMAVAYPQPNFEWQKWNGTSYNEVNGDKYVITSSHLFTSLNIFNIQQDDFVSYILKVSNGIQPYLQETFYLNPQDVPKCPTNFTLQSKSTTMATVQWKGEFNGGLRQTFVLVYKKRSDSKYITLFKPEDEQILIYITEIKKLEDGQLYDVILYSQNKIGLCKENNSLEFSTDTATEETTQSHAAVIGGVVGGGLGVAVVVIILVLVLRRKYTLNCVCKMFLSRKEEMDSDQNGHGADNLGYNAAETYEVVSTAKETPLYVALNDANDRSDNSHLYTPLDESNSKSHINYENVKSEDPVYNNTVLQNQVQTVL